MIHRPTINDSQPNPTIPNIQAINYDRKALQYATRGRDAVKIEPQLDLFYRGSQGQGQEQR